MTATIPTERPMLFSGHMVCPTLDGRKTQTRRAIKNATGDFWDHAAYSPVVAGGAIQGWRDPEGRLFSEGAPCPVCPHGVPGDRLWVREKWHTCPHCPDGFIAYGAGGFRQSVPGVVASNHTCALPLSRKCAAHGWKPSIHMPRWASRITLEIVDVRVERLNAITQDGALAEGATWTDNGVTEAARMRGQSTAEADKWGQAKAGWSHEGETDPDHCLGSARGSFWHLWESIYGPDSWDRNPWVWVITFKKVTP